MENSWHQSQPEGSSSESFTAPSKVFAIPELLEMILVHLPARDLLMCERINKTWHAVIKESNTLQEKLFYRCDLATLNSDMDKEDLEINPFFLLVQRRWSFAVYQENAADGFRGLDYPEASWKKMYLSRPAVCKVAMRKSPHTSSSDLSVQVIQHDTISMHHLRDSSTGLRFYARLIQSDGIRMHHLRGWNMSFIVFLTLTGQLFMTLHHRGHKMPSNCPYPSKRQFYDMYVSRQ